MFVEDLSGFVADFGVPVVASTGATTGLLSDADAEMGGILGRGPGALLDTDGAAVALRTTFVDVPTADVLAGGPLAGLGEDAALTVDGVAYVTRTIARLEDGAWTRIYLARVRS